MYRCFLCGTREILKVTTEYRGSVKQSDKHNLNMYAIRKSDKVIVVKKQANKVIIMRTAEFVERRTLTERNSVTAYCDQNTEFGVNNE